MTEAKQSAPTPFVAVHRIKSCRNDTAFVTGYAWDSDAMTYRAFREARERFAVPFAVADYLVDLYAVPEELEDTFPIAELGYRSLITRWAVSRPRKSSGQAFAPCPTLFLSLPPVACSAPGPAAAHPASPAPTVPPGPSSPGATGQGSVPRPGPQT
jgi:hypothetical protein